MAFKRNAVLLGACVLAGAVPLASVRADNFSVQGSLEGVACIPSLARTAQTGDGTLVLGRLVPDALLVIGSTTDAGRFSVFLGACGFAANTWISAGFYSSAAGAVSHGRLNRLSGHGAGWQYQLLALDAAKPQLDVGISPTVAAGPTSWSVDASNMTSLDYRVRYYRSGVTLIPGNSISSATYVLYHH